MKKRFVSSTIEPQRVEEDSFFFTSAESSVDEEEICLFDDAILTKILLIDKVFISNKIRLIAIKQVHMRRYSEMRARVEIRDRGKNNFFDSTIELPSDLYLHGPFDFFDPDGYKLDVKVEARSDHAGHLQLLFNRGKEKYVCFEFSDLKIGKEQMLFVGRNIPSWKFTKSPWQVSVTKHGD